jgi:hypothetical protein
MAFDVVVVRFRRTFIVAGTRETASGECAAQRSMADAGNIRSGSRRNSRNEKS